jgi:hypothetical protein
MLSSPSIEPKVLIAVLNTLHHFYGTLVDFRVLNSLIDRSSFSVMIVSCSIDVS